MHYKPPPISPKCSPQGTPIGWRIEQVEIADYRGIEDPGPNSSQSTRYWSPWSLLLKSYNDWPVYTGWPLFRWGRGGATARRSLLFEDGSLSFVVAGAPHRPSPVFHETIFFSFHLFFSPTSSCHLLFYKRPAHRLRDSGWISHVSFIKGKQLETICENTCRI